MSRSSSSSLSSPLSLDGEDCRVRKRASVLGSIRRKAGVKTLIQPELKEEETQSVENKWKRSLPASSHDVNEEQRYQGRKLRRQVRTKKITSVVEGGEGADLKPNVPKPVEDREETRKRNIKVKVKVELVEDEEKLALKGLKKSTSNLISKKLSSHARFQNITPFPDLIHPTAAECKLALQILVRLHGPRIRPEEVKAPNKTAGCGNSPSVLDALVRTILSQNTNGRNSTRAKLRMDEIYGRSDNWESIVAGGQSKLQEVIKCGGLSANKSRAILGILEEVHEKYGVYSLDHLHSRSNDEAMQELLSFPGVGPKTASCVLLFCLQRESFAVDTHVWRLSGFLGWRPVKASRDETFRHLDIRVPDGDKYALHILLIEHGKKCPECRAGGSGSSSVDGAAKCELRRAFSKQLKDEEEKRLSLLKMEE